MLYKSDQDSIITFTQTYSKGHWSVIRCVGLNTYRMFGNLIFFIQTFIY